MSKHTPGPWLAKYDVNGFYEISGEAVATPIPTASGVKTFMLQTRVAFTYEEGEIDEANARLIASAPELLEALRGLLDAHAVPSSICKERPAYDAARAAIAKAEGKHD